MFCGLLLLLTGACGRAPEGITVAAAANLNTAFEQIGAAFTAETGIPVTFSYGPTATLARQIENGAPFDVFAAADAEHVDSLIATGHLIKDSRVLYAIGQLALWAPSGGIQTLEDLATDRVKFVAIAQPDLAPYGMAAVEALHAAGLWDKVQPKLVYANSISQAKQMAATGNAEAALTAYSLVFAEPGSVLRLPEKLHTPIEQAIGVVTTSAHEGEARKFVAFVMGPKGRDVMISNGYLH